MQSRITAYGTVKRTGLRALLTLVLVAYALTILYPIFLMLITSLKSTADIFRNPFGLPKTLDLGHYVKVLTISNYPRYFLNSIIVTVASNLLVVVLTSMAAFVLAKYRFFANRFLYLYFVAGMIIPIKLGSISILKTMIQIHLYDHIGSLVIVNAAIGIPFGIFVLTDFIRMIPEELSNAARIDGYSEPKIFQGIIVPLLRPAIATVAVVNFIPFWNDFWFPLILIHTDDMKTVPLATALLFGQYQTNFGLVFAVLSLASIPVILFYLLLSKQFVQGLSQGALKG
jgi:raffinose/stachyose/melibiose transport system permease protein